MGSYQDVAPKVPTVHAPNGYRRAVQLVFWQFLWKWNSSKSKNQSLLELNISTYCIPCTWNNDTGYVLRTITVSSKNCKLQSVKRTSIKKHPSKYWPHQRTWQGCQSLDFSCSFGWRKKPEHGQHTQCQSEAYPQRSAALASGPSPPRTKPVDQSDKGVV